MAAKFCFDHDMDRTLLHMMKYSSYKRNIDCLCLFFKICLKDIHGRRIYAREFNINLLHIDTYLSNVVRLVNAKKTKLLYSHAIDISCGPIILKFLNNKKLWITFEIIRIYEFYANFPFKYL
jgi:hypothetical protein